jgi:hypothetical protein
MKRLFLLLTFVGGTVLPQAQDAQQDALKRAARFERSLTFVIDDDELLPGTLTVAEGQYRLDFRNHFTSSRLDLVLDDDKGKNFGAAELKEKREKEDLIVNLKAGKYVVFVRQRPKWRCVLTVTEKAKN